MGPDPVPNDHFGQFGPGSRPNSKPDPGPTWPGSKLAKKNQICIQNADLVPAWTRVSMEKGLDLVPINLLSFGLIPTSLEIMCCSSMTYERGQFQNYHLPKRDTLHTSAFVNHNSASHCPPLSAYCACNTTIASKRNLEYEHICSRGRDYKIGGVLDKSILKL